LTDDYGIKHPVEKIDPQHDHLRLKDFRPGQQVEFLGKPYVIQSRTTLASGEAAVVLQGEAEQFVVSAGEFLPAARLISRNQPAKEFTRRS
jgi:hypothetical protein